MRAHLAVSDLPNARFLCEFKSRSKGSALIMDKALFLAMCNLVWSKEGWPRITGHSFRIGGTTSLLRSGVDPKIVKKMGRWSSDTFLRYWRNLEEIFADHTANLNWVDFSL